MQKVKKLSLVDIQRIAAGQVVERPANVVKELVENSIDAHATKISIFLEHGGQTSIRVVDNGCGMSYEDAHACFEHHATSKIHSIDDLQQCMTFGFRGEALSSIASISTITLTTREHNALEGVTIARQSETVLREQAAACPTGTDITVHDIFYNVPVRKKFLKKEETELRVIVQLFQTFCFSFNSIHFQLYHNNKMIYNCPPVQGIAQRITQFFDDVSDDLLVLPHEENNIKMNGLISNQRVQRYNRNHFFFFVNKRWVRNYWLGKALLKGYQNSLQPDRYPLAVILIDVDPTIIDVNIHPRKEEVWFSNAAAIETHLSSLVQKTLQKTVSDDLKKSAVISSAREALPSLDMPTFFSFDPFPATVFSGEQLIKAPIQEKMEIKQEQLSETIHYKIIGVAHKTYIMIEHEEGILFVDQHAAHERILFERFGQRVAESAVNIFAIPHIVQLSQENSVLIQNYLEIFQAHGIEVELFGSNKVIIKAAPSYLKSFSWQQFLHSLVEELKENNEHIDSHALKESIMFKFRALMACKAAVKAGDILTKEQINQLLIDLDAADNHLTCPHGRPTQWLLRTKDLEKKFKR